MLPAEEPMSGNRLSCAAAPPVAATAPRAKLSRKAEVAVRMRSEDSESWRGGLEKPGGRSHIGHSQAARVSRIARHGCPDSFRYRRPADHPLHLGDLRLLRGGKELPQE